MRLVLFSAAIALAVALLGTPLAIRLFRRRGYGQQIRDDGPTTHQTKMGTPTMGGTVIIIATLLGYTLGHLMNWLLHIINGSKGGQPTLSGGLALGLMTGLGAVGFLDDFIKIWKQRSLGLRSGAKMAGQAVVAIAFAVLALRFPAHDLTPASAYLSFDRDVDWLYIGPILFVVLALVMVAGASNSVNLTDGLDGLATGASVMVFAGYVIIGNWQFRNSCVFHPSLQSCYEVRDPLDLAVVAAAVTGACFGFLWWNAPPARIFMGDTGSLALGGVMAALAIMTRTELLLLVLGGLFVIITLSVVVQVGFFKVTRRRVFRMAPLQHHFELVGWNEVTIVVRFWIITGLCVAAGLGLFYGRWLT